MLCFDKSKESPICSIILRQFLVIFLTPTFISFTKLKIRWSFWGAELIIGSKVMTQNATQAKKSRSFIVGVSFRLSSNYSLLIRWKSLRQQVRLSALKWFSCLFPHPFEYNLKGYNFKLYYYNKDEDLFVLLNVHKNCYVFVKNLPFSWPIAFSISFCLLFFF